MWWKICLKEILPDIKCLEEGMTILRMKMVLVKLYSSMTSYLSLIKHEQVSHGNNFFSELFSSEYFAFARDWNSKF
jgi:cAMP phosphodiesterase